MIESRIYKEKKSFSGVFVILRYLYIIIQNFNLSKETNNYKFYLFSHTLPLFMCIRNK